MCVGVDDAWVAHKRVVDLGWEGGGEQGVHVLCGKRKRVRHKLLGSVEGLRSHEVGVTEGHSSQGVDRVPPVPRSEEHTSELQSR